MTEGMKTIVYPVKDIAKAKARFSKLLGVEPHVDQPYYVGFRVGDQEVGLDPNGHKQGATPYWHVDDIKGTYQSLLAAGAQSQQEIKEVGGGRLVASLKDADGNVIGLIQDP